MVPRLIRRFDAVVALFILAVLLPGTRAVAQTNEVQLPAGVRAAWDLVNAEGQRTASRDRICINGLWRWQPAREAGAGAAVPPGGWGYFKVPAPWPGIT